MSYECFTNVITNLRSELLDDSDIVHSKRWQGAYIAGNPNMACYELIHKNFSVNMTVEDLDYYRHDIEPELPWADDHFEERVCGYPINPGTHWANWSHNTKAGAAGFLDERGKFNHNYMERYWPRFAGRVDLPSRDPGEWRRQFATDTRESGVAPVPNVGILYEYGDLADVIALLADDPYTRQAYLPVWFPEDTGGGSKRAPCTIGYHFLMRRERLDVSYHIRSCDFHKHFRNDLYLTVRLVRHVLEKVRLKNKDWADVTLGSFNMQIGSLHVFMPDWDKI